LIIFNGHIDFLGLFGFNKLSRKKENILRFVVFSDYSLEVSTEDISSLHQKNWSGGMAQARSRATT
jgi:hypothetical protein